MIPRLFSERIGDLWPEQRAVLTISEDDFEFADGTFLFEFVLGTPTLNDRIAHAIPVLDGSSADFPPLKIRGLFRRAELTEASFSSFPPEDIDSSVARDRYRAEWCKRRDIPLNVCGRLPDGGVEAPEYQAADRAAWCDLKDIAVCGTYFQNTVDDAFRVEWTVYRAATRSALAKPDLRGADLRNAELASAQLTGILLTRSSLSGANLSRARMEGANLSLAQMRSVSWSSATLRGALLQDTDLSLGTGLTQEQLNSAVGLGDNLLPASPDRLPPLEVADCWDQKPESWDSLMKVIFGEPDEDDLERAESTRLCSETNPKRFQTGPLP